MKLLYEHLTDRKGERINEKIRPCILVVPGGGYAVVSPSEGEIVAKKFYEMGYQTAVITYTTNLLMSAPLKMQPMKDLMRAIRYIRKHAKVLNVSEKQIILCGFSAGAHVHRESFMALLGVEAAEDELQYMSLEKQVKEDTDKWIKNQII